MTVDLDRRFEQWTESDREGPEIRLAFGLGDGGVGWLELIKKRRVVILAEAGSGKSTEFRERARLTALSSPYVFHASVEDVGNEGLDGALSPEARNRLAAWRKGADEAWLFIDSVDEAKTAGVKFQSVVRKIADGIHGAEERCHIFLSGRFTDWEPQRDFETLKQWLPVSSLTPMPERTPEEEILRIVRNQKEPKDKEVLDEQPYVAIMMRLDSKRVRTFAESQNVPNIDLFLKAIDDEDLWHFARRPMDLQWLIGFWKSEGRLGTLTEMVERSISEWLKETNPDRARSDNLNSVSALQAIERIGAAMVFGRISTIAIPDRGASSSTESSLDLADVLPDWSGDDRGTLLMRPIFDPGTLGRIRFHNDNDGLVRSFLAARWLLRLRKANLSTANLFRLLFANSYGLEVIRPSMNDTVAWLCLWDDDVGKEVIKRAPALLLSRGNPANLTVNLRSLALAALLRELTAENQESPWFNNDKLRQFAQSDLGETVLSLWPKYEAHVNASTLLMRLIWLGALRECGELARSVALKSDADPTLRMLAGKALLIIGDNTALEAYAALITTGADRLPATMVRDALLTFVPNLISVSDSLRILIGLNIEEDRNGYNFARDGVALAKKLSNADDLELLLKGLVDHLSSQIGNHSHYPQTKQEESFFPVMAELSLRLLEAVQADHVPPVVIDSLFRIGNRREHISDFNQTAKDALAQLHRTPGRRKQAFWRVVTTIRSVFPSQPCVTLWQVEFLGYEPNLKVEDVDWLLSDGIARGGEDCRLAFQIALTIYAHNDRPESILLKITGAAETDKVAKQRYEELTFPQAPSQAELDSERQLAEIEKQNKVARDELDQFWLKFVRDMQSDPQRIANLKLPIANNAFFDLIRLWQLLSGAVRQSHYAVDSVAPLQRMTGHELAKAFEDGLIAYWRSREPLIRSRRGIDGRNTTPWFDLMALAGVSLEAARESAWATKLSSKEARRAAEIATIEINGFPGWMRDLVAAHPSEVTSVFHDEIADEFKRPILSIFETLQGVAYSSGELAITLAPLLLRDLEAGIAIPHTATSHVLHILIDGLPKSELGRFEKICIKRFENEAELTVAVHYLVAAFRSNPSLATEVLLQKTGNLGDHEKKLAGRFLAECFGTRMLHSQLKSLVQPPADVIEKLMLLSFKISKLDARPPRPTGVYSINDESQEEWTRSAVFGRFVKTLAHIHITLYGVCRLIQALLFPQRE